MRHPPEGVPSLVVRQDDDDVRLSCLRLRRRPCLDRQQDRQQDRRADDGLTSRVVHRVNLAYGARHPSRRRSAEASCAGRWVRAIHEDRELGDQAAWRRAGLLHDDPDLYHRLTLADGSTQPRASWIGGAGSRAWCMTSAAGEHASWMRQDLPSRSPDGSVQGSRCTTCPQSRQTTRRPDSVDQRAGAHQEIRSAVRAKAPSWCVVGPRAGLRASGPTSALSTASDATSSHRPTTRSRSGPTCGGYPPCAGRGTHLRSRSDPPAVG